jgi:hypothetical protein
MNRRVLTVLVFTLCLCETARAQTARPTETSASSSPPWFPRAASLSVSLREGAVLPEARVQWQLVFFRSRHDSLGLLIEPSAAFAAVKPASPLDSSGALASLQLYSLLLGVGYTNRTESGLEWGFQVGSGPTWARARFTSTPARESAWMALLEGRARMGYRFGPVGLGVTVGYGDPYNYKRSSRSRPYIGGLQLGLYADWR